MPEDDAALADTHAVALVTLMLEAEDGQDPAAFHAYLNGRAREVGPAVLVSALASQATSLIRAISLSRGVSWQQTMRDVGMVSESARDE
jgi:hypothetical protein